MDIKESKEYRLAKDWEMAVNSFSFNPEPRTVRSGNPRHAPHASAKPVSPD